MHVEPSLETSGPARDGALRAAAVPAASTGGRLVFRDVYEQHVRFLWRALRRLGVADADADDVCQELFVIAHRKLAEYDGRAAVRTWLYGIAVRVASDYRRRAHIRREHVTASVPDESVPPEQLEALERRRAIDRLDAILRALDDDKRAVFVLYEIEGLPMSDVAAAIGCPLQTAYSRLHAARRIVEAEASRDERRPL